MDYVGTKESGTDLATQADLPTMGHWGHFATADTRFVGSSGYVPVAGLSQYLEAGVYRVTIQLDVNFNATGEIPGVFIDDGSNPIGLPSFWAGHTFNQRSPFILEELLTLTSPLTIRACIGTGYGHVDVTAYSPSSRMLIVQVG